MRENTQIITSQMKEQKKYRAIVQTVSWYSFDFDADSLENAYVLGSEQWDDFEPTQEIVVLLNVMPEVSAKQSSFIE